MNKIQFNIVLFLLIGLMQSIAQENIEEGNSAAQANNPLANMTALNIQNYYVSKLTDAPSDAYQNIGWVRFAKRFVSHLTSKSLTIYY